MEDDKPQETCKHRWEESYFGKQYWAPGTYQYTCARCGKMNMIVLGVDHGDGQTDLSE